MRLGDSLVIIPPSVDSDTVRWICSRGGFSCDEIKQHAMDAHDGSSEDQTIRVVGYCHQMSGLFKMTYIERLAALALLVPFVASNQITKSIESSQPNITRTITISPPASPAPGRQIHDAAYQSFSIEFSYMADYGGNTSCAIIKLI